LPNAELLGAGHRVLGARLARAVLYEQTVGGAFFPRFLCAGTHFSSATGQKSGRGAPSREEAAQARSLDARRILSIWERRQGSWQGHVEEV